MRALVYHGPQDVRCESVPDAVLPNERGAVVEVRSAGICGSDLHIYDGHGFVPGGGYTVGHEALGVVAEVGSAVGEFAVGDQVFLSAAVGCGHCGPCGRGIVSRCEHIEEGGVYGIGGNLAGCQAELVAVPAADMNLVAMPEGMSDESALVLTDNGPTGWYGARLGRIEPGDRVAVVGAGPVGLMAASAAQVMGAAQVFVVDLVPARRARAAAMGFTPVEGDPVAEVFRLTGGQGADVAVEAVGADATIQLAIDLVGRSGRVGVVGVSQTRDFAFDMLMAQIKCLELAIGLCSVQHELPALLSLTASGRLDPGAIVSHRFPLDAGADAYALFASRDDDVAKVMIDVAR